jgi:hypothetical protein
MPSSKRAPIDSGGDGGGKNSLQGAQNIRETRDALTSRQHKFLVNFSTAAFSDLIVSEGAALHELGASSIKFFVCADCVAFILFV